MKKKKEKLCSLQEHLVYLFTDFKSRGGNLLAITLDKEGFDALLDHFSNPRTYWPNKYPSMDTEEVQELGLLYGIKIQVQILRCVACIRVGTSQEPLRCKLKPGHPGDHTSEGSFTWGRI